MARSLPIPDFFAPERVGKLWKVDYARVAEAARRWRKQWDVRPASADETRVCLLLIDVQNTFCLPEFELFVAGRSGTGAVDDNRRLCEFIYRNLERLTQIVLTLDTHGPLQIFHPDFLVDSSGQPPAPHTVITAEDLRLGRWRVHPEAARAVGYDPEILQRYAVRYAESLESTGRFQWTVWPYHAMLGGIGHALVPAVEEAVFFHSVARFTAPRFEVKGNLPFTEYYSVFGPEVRRTPEGDTLERNRELIAYLADFDRVVVAGQAMSHCVAWSIRDLLDDPEFGTRIAAKMVALTDCMSPVVVPGVVNFTEQAESMFASFARRGVELTPSREMWQDESP
ncbi:MAG: hypothetical protein Kow00109_14270 [Acidobacteriota bacterium]